MEQLCTVQRWNSMFDFSDNPVIAHRGASAYAPENTLIAFDLALSYGAQWVEFDGVKVDAPK